MIGQFLCPSFIYDSTGKGVTRDSAMIIFDNVYTPPVSFIPPSHLNKKVYITWGTTTGQIADLSIQTESDGYDPNEGFPSTDYDDLHLTNVKYQTDAKGEYIIDLQPADLASHVKYKNYFTVPASGNYPRSEKDQTSQDPFVIANPANFSFKITLAP
jgi:hypothetical protein